MTDGETLVLLSLHGAHIVKTNERNDKENKKPVLYRYPLRFEQNDGIAPHGIR